MEGKKHLVTFGILVATSLLTAGIAVTPAAEAVICAPVTGEGSTSCGGALACSATLGQVRDHGVCATLEPIDCEPSGAPTTWTVQAGYQTGGPRDAVLGRVVCGGSTIAACTANFWQNPCASPFGDSAPGSGECVLEVFDSFDGIAVSGEYAQCSDPLDPSRVIPVTTVIRHTLEG